MQVVISGDSVMLDNLAAGFIAALEEGSETLATTSWLLAMSRDVASHQELGRIIHGLDPDLLIVSMGVWELDAVANDMHDPGWRDRYTTDVLARFVDRVTADGAQILWIGMPPWNNEPEADDLQTLQDIYRSFARQDDRVSFLDASEYVADASGRFTFELPDAAGNPQQVRNPDGLHYCPPGVVRVVEPALDWIQQRWPVSVTPDWQHLSWHLEADGSIRESFRGCPAT